MRDSVTQKIEPLERPNAHARLLEHLAHAVVEAEDVGEDIVDALLKLISSTKRRQLEQLPDITNEVEAA